MFRNYLRRCMYHTPPGKLYKQENLYSNLQSMQSSLFLKSKCCNQLNSICCFVVYNLGYSQCRKWRKCRLNIRLDRRCKLIHSNNIQGYNWNRYHHSYKSHKLLDNKGH